MLTIFIDNQIKGMENVPGIAWCDYVHFEYNGKLYDEGYDDAACQGFAFGYFLNPETNQFEFRLSDIAEAHEELRFHRRYTGSGSSFDPSTEKWTGRIYLRDGLLVFWDGLPDRTTLKKILSDLSKDFQESFDFDLSYNGIYLCVDKNGSVDIYDLEEYLGNKKCYQLDAEKRDKSEVEFAKQQGMDKLRKWTADDPHADRMYKDVVEEAQRYLGAASPDTIIARELNGRLVFDTDWLQRSADPHPFGYLDGKMIIGQTRQTHNDIVDDFEEKKEEPSSNSSSSSSSSSSSNSSDYSSDSSYYSCGRDRLKWPGRVWFNKEAIAFWGDAMPDKAQMRIVISDLERAIKEYLGQIIDLYDYTLFYQISDYDYDIEAITIREYITGSEKKVDTDTLNQRNRNNADSVLAQNNGMHKYNDALQNDPRMDPMYAKFVAERKKELLRRVIKEALVASIKGKRKSPAR